MTLVLVMIFNILVAFALGFVFGRIFQIRRDELERRDGFALPPTAHIPPPLSSAAKLLSKDDARRIAPSPRFVSWWSASDVFSVLKSSASSQMGLLGVHVIF
jgi:hypothetical protein